jgi:phage tail-like protein
MEHAGVTPKSMHQKWQFGVFIDGFLAGYFQKADLPETEFDESVFAPGGAISDQKTAGRAKHNDITLEKGIPQGESDNALISWLEQALDQENGTGGHPESYMRDVDIALFDRQGEEIKRYRLKDAWVKTAKFGELEGNSSDPTIESVTVCYNRWQKV